MLHSWYGYPAEGLPPSLKVLGKAAGLIPYLRRRAYYSLKLRLPWTGKGRLLDVGCGNGIYLLYMQALGWDAVGVDPDPSAVEACHQAGLTAYAGTLESQHFPEAYFDAITMSHVIEHVSDPVALLQECYRILRPGGYIGIVTPNWKSLGHKLFKADWFGLEIPRHFFLYTPTSLRILLERVGYSPDKVQTLSNKWMLQCIYGLSKQFEKYGRAEGEVSSLRMRAFELAERLLHVFFPYIGEEILVIAQKPTRL